jgi:hypothetical protein
MIMINVRSCPLVLVYVLVSSNDLFSLWVAMVRCMVDAHALNGFNNEIHEIRVNARFNSLLRFTVLDYSI